MKSKLKELETKRESYRFITEKLSNVSLSELERKKFVEENKQMIKELNQLSKEIAEINWDMMSPEQQQDYQKKYSED